MGSLLFSQIVVTADPGTLRSRIDSAGVSGAVVGKPGTESAGINRHIVGDERALQKRRSDSILASSLACELARDHSEA
jgi:hypothetical protein